MSKGMQIQASESEIVLFFFPQFGSIFLQNYVHLK